MNTLVLAEKPSVARDLAKVLGASQRRDGYLEGGGYLITWAVGHLLGIAKPGEQNPDWKGHVRRSELPMAPKRFKLCRREGVESQLKIVVGLLGRSDISKLVIATDAAREGQLIAHFVIEHAGYEGPCERLWISSMTEEAIRNGFASLKPDDAYKGLTAAARGRAYADWITGMSGSTAMRLSAHRSSVPVGRVMTPTLAMVVERDLAIEDFQPEPFWEVVASLQVPAGDGEESFDAVWQPDPSSGADSRRIHEEASAQETSERLAGGHAQITEVKCEPKRSRAPKLFDLTELQRAANKLFGFSAAQTLQLAQALYQEHKCLSYPRTDSRYLSASAAAELPPIVEALKGIYASSALHASTGEISKLSKSHVDDSKVSDHHALMPVAVPDLETLSPDEAKIFDLVCRRILMMWQGDLVELETRVSVRVLSGSEGEMPASEDWLVASGKAVREEGWRTLDPSPRRESARLPVLEEGEAKVSGVRVEAKKTSPPKRFTEAALLTAMESAGKLLDDDELADAMKEGGLGTPATRAATIEKLMSRKLLERKGKSVLSTALGREAIDASPPSLCSPVLTAEWEHELSRVERGELSLADFLASSIERVSAICEQILGPEPVLDAARFEEAVVGAINAAQFGNLSTGQLFKICGPSLEIGDRDFFEDALRGLAEKGVIVLEKKDLPAKGMKKATSFFTASIPEDRLLDGVEVAPIKALILTKLAKPTSSGRLHKAAGAGVSRRVFEAVLDEMVEKGEVVSSEESFEKEGETIAWRKISLAEVVAA